MAKFAPIGPPHLLRRIKDRHGAAMLGNYHLVLAHDIVENYKEWENLLPEGSTVIIDNGIIELGGPVVWEVMLSAYDVLGPAVKRVIVLPDAFDDPQSTYLQSSEYLDRIKPKTPDAEFMFVIQQKAPEDIGETLLTAAFPLLERGVKWLSVPRRVCDNFGTRMHALLQVRALQLMYPPGVKIHLMGFSNNIMDDIICSRELGVEGIDSAMPLRLGQQGLYIDLEFKGDQAGPRGTFWTDKHDEILHPTIHNLSLIKRAVWNQQLWSLGDYTPRFNLAQ